MLHRYVDYSACAALALYLRYVPAIQEVVDTDLLGPKLYRQRTCCFPPLRRMACARVYLVLELEHLDGPRLSPLSIYLSIYPVLSF